MSTQLQALHPSDFTPPQWVVSRQSIKSGGLTIEHHRHDPGELEVPALSHHLLMVRLSSSRTRQLTRFGTQEYDGTYPVGGFWSVAADNTSCLWSWESIDETILFTIDPLPFQEIAKENGDVGLANLELKNITFGVDAQLEFLAKQYRAEMQHGGLGGRLYSESLGNLLLLHLLRNYCRQSPKLRKYEVGLGKRRLNRLLEYIDAHLSDNISLKDLAAITGLGQCHFSVMFKQSLGVSPYRYVLLQRIERAKIYLRKGNQSIYEIALACGFADQSHLTKHFRKSVGMTPKAFREQ